jgi:Carboxypeptidase regulatory-like domain
MHTTPSFQRAASLTVALLLLLIFLTLAKPVSAQTAAGSIIGSVEDANGARLPGAKITAINDGTGQRREAVSNSDGEFQIIGLQNGKYHVEVTLNGFGQKTFNEMQIEPNTPFNLKVTLTPAGVTEIVNITSEGQLLQTENSAQATALTEKELTSLPTASRNITHADRRADQGLVGVALASTHIQREPGQRPARGLLRSGQ